MSVSRYPLFFFIYLSFVVYGSLVPLDYVPMTFDEAAGRFINIPWLRLGAMARADWVANILLYVPLSFLLLSALTRISPRVASLNVAITLLFCLTVAVCVEFVQVYFPPRTVSLNDLLAEFIGAVTGVAICIFFGSRIYKLGMGVLLGDRTSFYSFLWAYLLIYLLLCLFPFDFVLSQQELQAKLHSKLTGLLYAREGCNGVSRCAFKPFIEALSTIPVGVLLASRERFHRHSILFAVAAGLMFGLLVELSQVLIVSGVSQGVSVLSKSLGIVAGYMMSRNGEMILTMIARSNPKSWVAWLSVPYLIALLVANKWFSAEWGTLFDALESLSKTRFLPFYYHYFTTETVAMASLFFNGFLYSPLGIAAAFLQKDRLLPSYWLTVVVAASFALLIESAKLFHSGTHADPTNIIIAVAFVAIAQFIGVRILSLVTGSGREIEHASEPNEVTMVPKVAVDVVSTPTKTNLSRLMSGLILIGISAFSLYAMPVAMPWLMVAGVVLLLAQYVFPLTWLYVLPAVITVLDLTPWSGRFFWDESDALLLLLIGALLITNAPHKTLKGIGSRVMLFLLLVSWGSAALMPISPLSAIGMNSFNNYFGGFNSLRVGKGFFWALVFMPFLAIVANDLSARLAFLRGVLVGAVLLAGWVIVERQLFSGLFNFSNDFRVTASLSTMHTGGGHIEAFLVVLFPCAVCWFLEEKGHWKLLVAPVVFLALGYSLVVTYARAGYGAFLISMILMGLFFGARTRLPGLMQGIAKPLLLVVSGGCLFVFLIVQSPYVQQRMGSVGHDLETRLNHWKTSVEMMDEGIATKLFGMGLGQYPLTYAFRNPADIRLANYKFSGTRKNPYFELAAGDTLYYEQVIDPQPNSIYTLSIDVKSNVERGSITTPICEKAMLYSFQCKWITLSYERSVDGWQTLTHTFNSGKLGGGDIFNARPVKFSIYNPTPHSTVSVDNISLKDADGYDLIQNGTFSATSDHWFFSTDNHLPWHIKQLGVQIYFSQGLVGLIVFVVFLLSTLNGLFKRAIAGDVLSATLVSSIVAFVLVGFFASLFDAPRLTFVFFSLMFIARHRIAESMSRIR